MIIPNIDPFPVAQLQELFGLRRTAVYERIKKLGIVPLKDGRETFVSREDLEQLIGLHEFLKADSSRTIADFLPQDLATCSADITNASGEQVKTRSANASDLFGEHLGDFIQLVQAIATLFPSDPLANYKALALAAKEEWLLPTNKVRELIGVKPQGETFRRGNWMFERRGKIGNQAAWLVTGVSSRGSQ